MIDGLRLDINADELVKLLDDRIAEHTENAESDDDNARRLDQTKRADEEDWEDNQGSRLRRRAQGERDRADALTFMRNHVIRGETYRLT
jgi:hypothetical protein